MGLERCPWSGPPGQAAANEWRVCYVGGRRSGRAEGWEGVSVHLGGIERLAAVVRQDVLVRVRLRLRLRLRVRFRLRLRLRLRVRVRGSNITG